MNLLHSSVFGRTTHDTVTRIRNTTNDLLVVEWDDSGRLHDVRYVLPNEKVNQATTNHGSTTVFEPPFHGLSVHQGKSIQWMLWNEIDFRDLRFYGATDTPHTDHLWLGADYTINGITLYRSWGRVVGFSITAILDGRDRSGGSGEEDGGDLTVLEEVIDERHVTEIDEPEESMKVDVLNSDQMVGTMGHGDDGVFFFSDDHIWYIQISLLILASLIILINLISQMSLGSRTQS